MNYRIIFNTLGKVALVLAALLVLPMVIAASLTESCWWAFAVTIGISAVVGVVLVFALRPKNNVFFSKEGLIIVSLSWVYVSLIGALPFVISGARRVIRNHKRIFHNGRNHTARRANRNNGKRFAVLAEFYPLDRGYGSNSFGNGGYDGRKRTQYAHFTCGNARSYR